MSSFFKRATALNDELLSFRRYLHENAEYGDNLPLATQYVMEQLRKFGLEPQEICKSGVTATITGNRPGKTILLRADMDALPMPETADLPFKTKTEYAHTCGHDMHAAMLLCAAKMLAERKDELEGSVKLMFQPAEEIFTGAQAMLEAGLMENPKVDAALALHVISDLLPCGTLGCGKGFILSSCDGFKITITGKGCHGAQPHNGIDPINAAVHLHLALQGLIARETPPEKIASLTIGQFVAGTTPNIIPEKAILQGTLRTYDKELRAYLVKRMREIIDYTAKTFGASAEIEILSDVPAIYANPDIVDEYVGYLKEMDAQLQYKMDFRLTPSDDFSRVAELVPSAFIAIGAMAENPSLIYPHHNPNIVFNEEALPIGAAVYAQCAFNWLKNNK